MGRRRGTERVPGCTAVHDCDGHRRAGLCPAASRIWANSPRLMDAPSRAGGCGFAGHAVNPSVEACRKHPCFLQSRKPAPADPRRCAAGHGRSTAVPIISMRYRTVVRSVRSFGNPPRRATPCVADFRIRRRPSVGAARRPPQHAKTETLPLRAKYPPATPHRASLPARQSRARSTHPSSAARVWRGGAATGIPCRARGTATTSPPASTTRRAGRRW